MEIDSRCTYNLQGLTSNAKTELREKIPNLQYVDVRRYRWPFCQALINEAYEENCLLSAEFLLSVSRLNDYLVENSYMESVCNSRKFLLWLSDCLKSAETCGFFLKEEEKSLKILLNTAVYVEKNYPQFVWLSEKLYIILIQWIERFENKFEETEARAFYFYGRVLNRKLCNFEDAIACLEKSLQLCKGMEWTKIPGLDTYLSKHVSEELCIAFLKLAGRVEKRDLTESERLTKKAILALMQGSRDKFLYCKAGIKRSEYLIKLELYREALKMLHKVFPYAYFVGKAQYKAEILLNQGICYFYLTKYAQTIKKLKEAIRTEGVLPLKHIRARIYCFLGRVYAKERSTFVEAQSYLWIAKTMFEEVGDIKNATKTKFLSGITKANEVLPHLVKLIKGNDPDSKYKMWLWKDCLKPFWTDRTIKDVLQPDEIFIEVPNTV